MIRTHGLTHVAISVADVDRAFRFYRDLFGAIEVYREPTFVQAQLPGTRDIFVFQHDPDRAGKAGGIQHFGFRLTDPAHIDDAAKAVTAVGGTVREQGDFCPGEPYLFALDPDGYEIEIWYELPTSADPGLD